MKKQCMIAVCTAGFLIGITGCSKNTENAQVKTTGVVTEGAVEATVSVTTESAVIGSTLTKKIVNEGLYNTITDGIYTSENGEMQMQVPKNWKTIENDKSILIVPDTEEAIADNLHVQIADKDVNFASYTEATFKKSFEEKFGEISFEKFEKTTIVGLPAIKMVYKITQDSVETTEYQYMIDGNRTIIITYTNVNDLLTEDELETCINSIQILK